MMLFRRSPSLPLGIDLGSDSISIVAGEATGDGFAIRETRTLEVTATDPCSDDLKIAQTLHEALRGLRTRERRCVLAAPVSAVVTRVFRLPPNMRRREKERAAALEADLIVNWPANERLIALDAIPKRDDEMLLSIARTSTIERLVSIARASGLRPVAVDIPSCAWRRAVRDADAVLDCLTECAALSIFGDPIGTTQLFAPRLADERLATGIRSAFTEARRDAICDVQQLAVLGSRFRYESIEELLRGQGYAIVPVTLGGLESPPWTFAFGLAAWSIASIGVAA